MKKIKCKIIVCILILIVLMMTCLGIIYKNKLTNTEEENNISEIEKNIEFDNTVTNNIVENTLASLEENTTIIEPVKEDMVIETDTPKVEKVNKKSEKNSSQEDLITPVSPEISVAQETTINKPKENSNNIPNLNDKPIEDTQTQVETIPTEEYRYNDSMTQTIVNIINNNPSSYMLQDGYTVLIDSSIVTLTNQFTYTEQRVINKISQKAGTIRVYAQDYYFNGEILFTECYIY